MFLIGPPAEDCLCLGPHKGLLDLMIEGVFGTTHRFIRFDDRGGLKYLILLHNAIHGLTPLSQNWHILRKKYLLFFNIHNHKVNSLKKFEKRKLFPIFIVLQKLLQVSDNVI